MNLKQSRQTRCLFVSHDAYRAGATIFLLNMLRWLKQHGDIEFEIAIRSDGEMAEHFAAIGPTHVLAVPEKTDTHRRRLPRCLRAISSRSSPRHKSLGALIDDGRFDVLYLNTITLGDHIETLGACRPPIITHVHEMPSAIRKYARGKEELVLNLSARVICVSEAVRSSLNARYAVANTKSQLIYGFVPYRPDSGQARSVLRRKLIEPLGIQPDAWVIGFCGYGDLRKGIDLVVPLAAMLPEFVDKRPVHLVWVGLQAAEYPREVALDDAVRAGVASRVHFPGISEAPLEWMACFDLHVLLSREDPFPLVVMEAGGLGVPTLAFADSGGAGEFIGEDAGLCTPYLDLAAMSQAVVDLLANPSRLRSFGQTAKQRVQERHSPDIVLPRILRVIHEVSRIGVMP